MRLDVTPEETELLRILLEKDIEETRVEVHHAKNTDFKAHLRAHGERAQGLLERLMANV